MALSRYPVAAATAALATAALVTASACAPSAANPAAPASTATATRATATPTPSFTRDPYVLLKPAEVDALRADPTPFTPTVKACTNDLARTPAPVASLDLDPHYTSDGDDPDSKAANTLAGDAQAAYRLGLCGLLTRDQRYSTKAQTIIDAWSTTLVSVTTDQGKDALNFGMPYLIASATYVRGVGGWDGARFGRFLRKTVLPNSLASNPNNHGLWAVFMEAAAADYLRDATLLTKARNRWSAILAGAVAADGTMPREMTRSDTNDWRGGPTKGIKGIAYTHYALLPAAMAAKVFADAGTPVWNTSSGRLMASAFAKVAGWTLDPTTFPYYASNNGKLVGVTNASYFPLLLRYYPDADASAVVARGGITADGFLLTRLFAQQPTR